MTTEIRNLDKEGLTSVWDRTKSYVNESLAGVVTTFDYDVVGTIEAPALGIPQGGTGATTAEEARINLELGALATEDIVSIEQGGTGASDPITAIANLGGIEIDRLWTNPNVSEEFAGDDIDIASDVLNDYYFFIALFNVSNATGRKLSCIGIRQWYGEIQWTGNMTNTVAAMHCARQFLPDANGGKIHFGDCYVKQNDTSKVNNIYLIPYRVYGIKGAKTRNV